jgi:hypothetical protein
MLSNKKYRTLSYLLTLTIALTLAACKPAAEPAVKEMGSLLTPLTPTGLPAENLPEHVENPDASVTLPIQTPVLEVYKINSFTDSFGTYRVIGLVRNNSDQVLDNLEVEVAIFDPDGNLLHSEVIRTLLYTLAPGESTPFSLRVLSALPEARDVFGTAVSSGPTDLKRRIIETRNSVVTIDDYGNVHVTGELFNNTKDPVQINGLAAVTFDQDGGLLTADSFSEGSHYLDPGESGPFRVTMTGPAERITEIGEYHIFVDSEAAPPQDYLDLNFSEPQYYYIDGFDSFHLIGEITNNTNKSLTIEILAAVYDEAGNVIDVASTHLPLNTLAAGSSLPYDFNTWGPLNTKAGLVDSAVKYSVQWDPYWTFQSDAKSIDLPTTDEKYTVEGGYAIFEGSVENDSGNLLRDAVVIVSLVDARSGQILAMDYESYFDELPNGQTFNYRIEVEIEPNLDFETVKIVIVAKGELPE